MANIQLSILAYDGLAVIVNRGKFKGWTGIVHIDRSNERVNVVFDDGSYMKVTSAASFRLAKDEQFTKWQSRHIAINTVMIYENDIRHTLDTFGVDYTSFHGLYYILKPDHQNALDSINDCLPDEDWYLDNRGDKGVFLVYQGAPESKEWENINPQKEYWTPVR
jgi:hypothetical protein